MIDTQENWEGKKKILIILAHPDDPEFFLGGSIVRWTQAGHYVSYCLLTKGEKGSSDFSLTPQALAQIRVLEQKQAAAILGVDQVEYLDYADGGLIPDLATRKEVVRAIRKHIPDILVTCDPLNYFSNKRYINHPDHRAAGQVVIDAVFPAAGNAFYYPELMGEGFLPHSVEEVWMSLTGEPNVVLDVSEYWPLRMSALLQHTSQIGDTDVFEQRMRDWLEKDEGGNIKYEEKFRRIIFRR